MVNQFTNHQVQQATYEKTQLFSQTLTELLVSRLQLIKNMSILSGHIREKHFVSTSQKPEKGAVQSCVREWIVIPGERSTGLWPRTLDINFLE